MSQPEHSKTVTDILQEEKLPAVCIDRTGLFVMVNKAFEEAYGWTREELLGQSITLIIPPYLREGHLIGFSRFLVTETPTLIGKKLPLKILYKDGSIKDAEHYIVSEKHNGEWRFAATIVPINEPT